MKQSSLNIRLFLVLNVHLIDNLFSMIFFSHLVVPFNVLIGNVSLFPVYFNELLNQFVLCADLKRL